jgi:hypothetical protein
VGGARSRDADIVIDSQEPHGHEMNAAVFIECSEVSDESHRKEFVDFDRAENKGLVCRDVRRVVCHILLSKVAAVFANGVLQLTRGIAYYYLQIY